jgi:hypothetical protein
MASARADRAHRPAPAYDPSILEARLKTGVVLGELTLTPDRPESGLLRVQLTGRSAERDAGRVLGPVLERVLASAVLEKRHLALHFERLEYFNSSTIAALVQFIRACQHAKVPLTIRYDARLRWQATSFDALRRAMHPMDPAVASGVTFDGGQA